MAAVKEFQDKNELAVKEAPICIQNLFRTYTQMIYRENTHYLVPLHFINTWTQINMIYMYDATP
jgi:hypothetical protein